jgi:hypothetical protein
VRAREIETRRDAGVARIPPISLPARREPDFDAGVMDCRTALALLGGGDQADRRALIAIPTGFVGRGCRPNNRQQGNKIGEEDDGQVRRLKFGRHENDLVAASTACH